MHLATRIYTFSSVLLMYSWFIRHISFSLFMPINFNIIHTYVSIHDTSAYWVLSNSYKYFYFGSHICLFIPMITYVFYDWKTYCQELHSVCMYVHIYICAHKDIHLCSSAYIWPSMHAYLHTDSCMYVYIHAYIQV